MPPHTDDPEFQEWIKLVELIKLISSTKRTTLVAIDGLAGAGKSTLTYRLVQELKDTEIVNADDFYRPLPNIVGKELTPKELYDSYMDWYRLLHQVLVPLKMESTTTYRRYDWVTNRLAEWNKINPQKVILVDGVYSIRPELRQYYAVAVYIDTPKKKRLERILARGYEDSSWIKSWMMAEQWYEKHMRPAEHADLVING